MAVASPSSTKLPRQLAGAGERLVVPHERRYETDKRWARRLTLDDVIKAVITMLEALRSALAIVIVGYSSVATAGDTGDYAALATALEDVKGTLEDGLKASERVGKPISATFALEHGTLQLSLWISKQGGFSEFILYPVIHFITESLEFTDPDKLEIATTQKLAMDKATVSLLSATENTVKANDGLRAVSVYPVLKEGHPTAVITLLGADAFKIVTEKLY
jgi:hypothetical protein